MLYRGTMTDISAIGPKELVVINTKLFVPHLPDSSEDEVRHSSRISFTTPGFDRLDSRTFEEFGDDITSLEQQRMEKEKEWEVRKGGREGGIE